MKVMTLNPLPAPINAKINIPGSKSYTNRALIIASLSENPVKIFNPLICNDTQAMAHCLKALGFSVVFKKNLIEVRSDLKTVKKTCKLNACFSGTTIRFMLALSVVTSGTKTIFGKDQLNKRPIGELVLALSRLGAKIKYLQKAGFPPLKVFPARLKKKAVEIRGNISSQFLSALLMVAPVIDGLKIKVKGQQISKPYIDMTISIMDYFGVKVKNNGYRNYFVPPNQKYLAKDYTVEGDLSSAGYFFAIAALTKSTISVGNLNFLSKQADMKLLRILSEMGSKISFAKNRITVAGKGVKPVDINMQDCPDQIPTVAVLAAFAFGMSKISGISSLRIKETDRVFALQQELKKMGIQTAASKNTLTIYGGNPKACSIKTYGDHRMAMSFATAGTKLAGMKIINPDVVNKTFPQFWQRLAALGSKTSVKEYKNITLIGMRRSGKTTTAKILSRKLNKPYLELDELIAKKASCSIAQIVAKHGWQFFRNLESEVVAKASLQEGEIISTGGGVILNPDNVKALKKKGALVWLKTSLPQLIQRTKNDKSRPPLTENKDQKTEIAEVLKLRKDLYEKAADLVIETDYQSREEIADQIIREVNYAGN